MRVRRVCTCCLLFLLIIAAGAWASANRAPAGRGNHLSARHGSWHLRPDRARKVRVHRLKTVRRLKAKTSSSVGVKATMLAAGDPVLFGEATVTQGRVDEEVVAQLEFVAATPILTVPPSGPTMRPDARSAHPSPTASTASSSTSRPATSP